MSVGLGMTDDISICRAPRAPAHCGSVPAHRRSHPFAPTPFINMYVFWMVCMALCSHWLMLSVNCLQIRQCCGSSPRTLETRLETAQLFSPFPFLPPCFFACFCSYGPHHLIHDPPPSFCTAPPSLFNPSLSSHIPTSVVTEIGRK